MVGGGGEGVAHADRMRWSKQQAERLKQHTPAARDLINSSSSNNNDNTSAAPGRQHPNQAWYLGRLDDILEPDSTRAQTRDTPPPGKKKKTRPRPRGGFEIISEMYSVGRVPSADMYVSIRPRPGRRRR